jgi:DNA-binding YbaB/EbfC family protein
MFGNMNMQELGKMLEGMQEQTQKMEEELASKELTVKTGGGLLKVVMSGKGEMIDIDIDDSLMEDKESLQILLIAAINDANKMVEDNKKKSAMGMLGGMNPFAQS